MPFSVVAVVVILLSFFCTVFAQSNCGDSNTDTDTNFDQNYYITWGKDHFQSTNQGKEIQLSLDASSGSGFASKLNYGSGFFHSRMMIPGTNSAGVITTFYLKSPDKYGHDELDFEFLGNTEGKPITLQTNVFVNGKGNREQRLNLWFDPTADFHSYKILWNPHQIVFYVDNIPIRVFKNNSDAGIAYPSLSMQIQASLWNGDWATAGAKINWTFAPFKAHFREFGISGCPSQTSKVDQQCYSSKYCWNTNEFSKLNSAQQSLYTIVKNKYVYYDYCSDTDRFPTPPPECLYVQ